MAKENLKVGELLSQTFRFPLIFANIVPFFQLYKVCQQGLHCVKLTKVSTEERTVYVADEADKVDLEHLLPKSRAAHLNTLKRLYSHFEGPRNPWPPGRNMVNQV